MKWFVQTLFSSALCLVVSQAMAGAWPRAKGETFVASSAILTWPNNRSYEYPDVYGSLYVEHGLGAKITMGLDIGSPDATDIDRLKTVGFLRYSLSPTSARHQFALDLGAGTYLGEDVLRAGMSYGVGFKSLGKDSWVTLGAHTLHALKGVGKTHSLDLTYGVSLAHGKIMGQFNAFQGFDKTQTMSFTPSYVRDIGHGRHIELGVTVGLRDAPDPILKIGIWQKF